MFGARALYIFHAMDPDSGSSVTLIYYRIGEKWWKEPFLNVVAAAAQMSSLTHVEIALGEEVGTNGMMTNVCRVFNDKVGVELVERTGRSPHYVYQSLGCSKAAVNRMLRYAKTQCVGKPFSNTGMARSLLWPRQTDGTSFFCAGKARHTLAVAALVYADHNGMRRAQNWSPPSSRREGCSRRAPTRAAPRPRPCTRFIRAERRRRPIHTCCATSTPPLA